MEEISEYACKSGAILRIATSSSGIFQASGDNEPAWAFRLWKASLVLAGYLEDHSQLIESKLVLDLGAGTGLLSILCSQLHAGLTISTDQSVALPLILHNARSNLTSQQVHQLAKSTNECSSNAMKCAKGHGLIVSATDSDEYMCNICEDEVAVGDQLFSCRLCNFDCCSACAGCIADPTKRESLPAWFKYSLEQEDDHKEGHEQTSAHGNLLAAELDWNQPDAFEQILAEAKALHLRFVEQLPVIIAADVTYSQPACMLFFSCLDSIASYYHGHGGTLKVILAHHRRSEETTALLFEQLQVRGWRHEVVATEGSGEAGGNQKACQEGERDDTVGDVSIVAVYIAI